MSRSVHKAGHQTTCQRVEFITWEVEQSCRVRREVVTSQTILRRSWVGWQTVGCYITARRIITHVGFRHRHLNISSAVIGSREGQRVWNAYRTPYVFSADSDDATILNTF